MATGKQPFSGPTPASTFDAILHSDPASITRKNTALSPELSGIVFRALEKTRKKRYQSMSEPLAALKVLRQESSGPVPISRIVKKPKVAIPAVAGLVVVGLLVAWGIRRSGQVRWAHETAIPEIARLAEKGEDQAAFALAKQVNAVVPDDALLQKLWPEISLEISVHSNPEGAEIYVKPYRAPEGSWEHIGRSPVEHLQVPFGLLRWRAEKQGFETAELLSYSLEKRKEFSFLGKGATLHLFLAAPGTIPEGMVRIP